MRYLDDCLVCYVVALVVEDSNHTYKFAISNGVVYKVICQIVCTTSLRM